MRYVIVTVEWCKSHGVVVPEYARKSLDGTKVIFHYEFIAPVVTESDELEVYNHNDSRLSEILGSEEWAEKEEPGVTPLSVEDN